MRSCARSRFAAIASSIFSDVDRLLVDLRHGLSRALPPHARLRRAADHLQFRLPARRLASRGAGRAGAGAGPRRPGAHRPQQPRRHRPGAPAGQGNGACASWSAAGSTWSDGTSLLCWPTDRPAYARLSSLLTHGKRLAAKGRLHADAGGRARPRRGAGVRAAAARDAGCRFRRAGPPAAAALAAALSRPVASLCRRRRLAPRRARRARPRRRRSGRSRPTTSTTTTPTAGRCRTWSPASASMRGSPRRRRSCSPTPSATSSRPRRWRACSATTRRRSRARWRSSSAAGSRWASWPTTTRCRTATTAARPTRSWRGARWAGAAERYPGHLPAKVEQQLRHELELIARAPLRALLPHRPRHRALRAQPGHPLPGPRLGRQLGRLLRAGRHRGRPGAGSTCCSSASSRPSATSRPTSTSTSSTSGARR